MSVRHHKLSGMDISAIGFGQSIAGLLVDGVEATPYTGATLKMDRDRGVVLEIPYIEQDETRQFSHVNDWFMNKTPPTNMYLMTPDGNIGLFGNRWRGHVITGGITLGKVMPGETLLGPCEAPLNKPLILNEVSSRIDGLQAWTRIKSINQAPRIDSTNLIQSIDVNIATVESKSWRQGEATLHFRSEWKTDRPIEGYEGGLNIDDGTVLVSSFPEERPFFEHLVEQRKVAGLLTLLSGGPIHFRQHKVSAKSIVLRALSGDIYHRSPRIPLISADTVREFDMPRPSISDLNWILSDFDQVGVSGLEQWAAGYEKWKRFILPAAGVFGRRGLYLEDVIVSLSYSIEAAGQIIGPRPGEENTYFNRNRPTTSTFVYRCLESLDVDWGPIAPNLCALARAIANTYNSIKHYDRGDFPAPDVQRVIGVVLRFTARLLALYIIDDTGDLLTDYRKERALLRAHNIFEQSDIRFDETGKPTSSTG